MNRKVMAVMICLAVLGMMGNALAQQQGPLAGTKSTVNGVTVDEMMTLVKG